MRAFVLLAVFVAQPAQAAPEIVASFEPMDGALLLRPGDRKELGMDWRVEVTETSCTASTEFGLDFVVEESPGYLGASFQPMGTTVEAEDSEGRTTLEVVAAEDAPASSTQIRVVPDLHPYNAQCTPTPTIREERSTVNIVVAAENPSPTTSTVDGTKGRSPDLNAFATLAALFVIVATRRLVG